MKRRLVWISAVVVLLGATAAWFWPRPPGPLPAQIGPVPELGTNATSIERLNEALLSMGGGTQPRVVRWNVSYMSETDDLDVKLLDAAAASGVVHHIVTLEIRHQTSGQLPLLQGIAAGQLDSRLQVLAGQMQAWQQAHPTSQLILRPLHEANSDWYPWGFLGSYGNTAADFGPAWARIRTVMREVFPSLPFFWCPNRLYGGQDSYQSWYPGDNQVEYVGADGYNRSQGNGNLSWENPREVHEATIRAIRQVSPAKPYIVGETGSSEPAWGARLAGHSKAQWFGEFGTWMTGFARHFGIVAVCYFNYDKRAENGNDWRVYPIGEDDAEASQEAFYQATKDLV